MKSGIVIISLLSIVMFTPLTHAGEPCSVELIRSMIEEGLSDDQIQSICDRAKLLQGSETQAEEDIYTKAQRLYVDQQFDDMITLLGDYCHDNHFDHTANVLLAKAYLEQAERMKADDDKGYKDLVMKPYYISRRFVTGDPEDADALYIAARSFLINNRPERGLKYIKKAISVSNKDMSEYYLALGDCIVKAGKNEASGYGDSFSANEGKEAYERAIQLAQIDWIKAKAQKRLDAIK